MPDIAVMVETGGLMLCALAFGEGDSLPLAPFLRPPRLAPPALPSVAALCAIGSCSGIGRVEAVWPKDVSEWNEEWAPLPLPLAADRNILDSTRWPLLPDSGAPNICGVCRLEENNGDCSGPTVAGNIEGEWWPNGNIRGDPLPLAAGALSASFSPPPLPLLTRCSFTFLARPSLAAAVLSAVEGPLAAAAAAEFAAAPSLALVLAASFAECLTSTPPPALLAAAWWWWWWLVAMMWNDGWTGNIPCIGAKNGGGNTGGRNLCCAAGSGGSDTPTARLETLCDEQRRTVPTGNGSGTLRALDTDRASGAGPVN